MKTQPQSTLGTQQTLTKHLRTFHTCKLKANHTNKHQTEKSSNRVVHPNTMQNPTENQTKARNTTITHKQ